jgi:hypothetical protein
VVADLGNSADIDTIGANDGHVLADLVVHRMLLGRDNWECNASWERALHR